MSIYYPSGCDAAVPDHFCDPCEAIEHGRVRSVAFVKSSVVFNDETSPVEWLAAIETKDIIIIPDTLGAFDGGAPVEATGYGEQATKITGYNFSLTFKDPNYKENADFYNGLKASRSYRVAWRTETQTHLSDATVSVIPKNPVTENLTDEVVWDVEVKFSQGDLPAPFDTPTGVFDCFAYSA